MKDVFGKPVQMASGQTLTADENYVRESIEYPQAKIVVGYQAIMPTFKGQVTPEQINQLIAYIKSLSSASSTGGTAPANANTSPTGGATTTQPANSNKGGAQNNNQNSNRNSNQKPGGE